MSKKIIAVVSAAALALTALVGIAPANSAEGAFSVTQNGAITATAARDGVLSTTAFQINVPSADVIRYVATSTETPSTWNSTIATAVKFTVVTPASGDAITVTSTGGVKLLTATQFGASTAPTTATGTQSLSLVNTVNAVEFYAYTTSTTAGTVVVGSGGNQKTTHLTGVSTSGYKLALTTAATAALGGKITLVGTVKDAFGNDLTTPLVFAGFTPAAVGATNATAVTYSSTAKTYSFEFTAPTTAQPVAVQVSLAVVPTSVTAFGAPVVTQFFSVSAQDLTAQITSLNAQITALTAQLAALTASTVTKADYNKLVRKYNRTNPAKKVARVL